MGENIINNESRDHSYFILTPQIVWAKCKTTFEFTLWSVVKMIAGENGVCYLTTENLATLAMMSEGSVSEARQALLDAGLLAGEERPARRGGSPVWHLTIPNLWRENVTWREKLGNEIADRIAFKNRQNNRRGNGRTCGICDATFTTRGRGRFQRCDECKNGIERERRRLYDRDRTLKSTKLADVGKCERCGETKTTLLELHEQQNGDGDVALLCHSCHNAEHKQLRLSRSSGEREGSRSSGEQPRSSDEQPRSPDEQPRSPDEGNQELIEEELIQNLNQPPPPPAGGGENQSSLNELDENERESLLLGLEFYPGPATHYSRESCLTRESITAWSAYMQNSKCGPGAIIETFWKHGVFAPPAAITNEVNKNGINRNDSSQNENGSAGKRERLSDADARAEIENI